MSVHFSPFGASRRRPRRHDHPGRSAVVFAVALLTLASCAGVAEEIGSTPASAPGTTAVIGGADPVPPATNPTTTASTQPLPTVAPAPPHVPTEAYRRFTAAGVNGLAARAYLNASQRAPEALPNCKVPPEVLAAVGAAESRHGTIGSFDEDGTTRDPILGYASVGDDTDGGLLDGDTENDYAVGPMQFTPETWTELGRDGDGDGDLDPHNFYDAALATAAYLCHLAGPFPDARFIAGQWDHWDRQKQQLEQRTKILHEQWEKQKSDRQRLETYVAENPDDTTNAAVLDRLPPLPAEPEYQEPARPAGPAQLRLGVERYYGPESKVRDDYRDNVESAFRGLIAGTGGVAVTPDDRLP